MNREISTLERKLNELKDKLQHTQLELSVDLFNEQLIITEKDTLLQLEKWITIHEKVLRQKSRATWLVYGDSNTKFFHTTLKARQARNKISSICTEHGIQLHEPTLIQKEFIGFFQNLLGTAAAEMPCLDQTIARDGPCLTNEQKLDLIHEVTEIEVLQALKDLSTDKAPSIDGFLAEFFK
nr:uncharacterized protein LOC104093556 [Nicotiana tomentosiformis]